MLVLQSKVLQIQVPRTMDDSLLTHLKEKSLLGHKAFNQFSNGSSHKNEKLTKY